MSKETFPAEKKRQLDETGKNLLSEARALQLVLEKGPGRRALIVTGASNVMTQVGKIMLLLDIPADEVTQAYLASIAELERA